MPEYIQFDKTSTPVSSPNTDTFILQIDSNNSMSLVDNTGAPAAVGEATASALPMYYALLSQSGSNAPTATIIKNTLGMTPTWYRSGTGEYYANNFSSSGGYNMESSSLFISKNIPNSTFINMRLKSGSTEEINIFTYSGSLSDNILNNTPIEIKIYP